MAAAEDREAVGLEEGGEASPEEAARPRHEQAQAILRANIAPLSLIP